MWVVLTTTHNYCTHNYSQLLTTTVLTTTHNYSQLLTTTHNYCTHNYSQLLTTTHSYCTHNYSQLLTTTHNYSQLLYSQRLTTTHNYSQLLTTTRNYSRDMCVQLTRDIKRCATYISPKLQIIFHKRATKYRSLLRKMTQKDKAYHLSCRSFSTKEPLNIGHFCGKWLIKTCLQM